MSEHRVEPCDWPIKSRRWRNTIWVCPKCGQAWTMVKAWKPSPDSLTRYETPCWTWWKWPFS
jgi:ribosomal protein L37AE/L43A